MKLLYQAVALLATVLQKTFSLSRWDSLASSPGGASSPTQRLILHWQCSHHGSQFQSGTLSESYLWVRLPQLFTYPVSISANHCRLCFLIWQPLWLFTFKLLKETEVLVLSTNHLFQELTVHIWLGCPVQ